METDLFENGQLAAKVLIEKLKIDRKRPKPALVILGTGQGKIEKFLGEIK